MGIRKGRREAYENLSISEEGDCPRCGGEKQPSSLAGYLSCVRCGYEWKDPNHAAQKRGPPETYRRDAELIEEFKQEMQSGDLTNVLGIDKGLSGEQEASTEEIGRQVDERHERSLQRGCRREKTTDDLI